MEVKRAKIAWFLIIAEEAGPIRIEILDYSRSYLFKKPNPDRRNFRRVDPRILSDWLNY